MTARTFRNALFAATMAAGTLAIAAPAHAQVSVQTDRVHAGSLSIPVSKSEVLELDRPYARALVGNPEVADVLPLSDQGLYVLGRSMGTTSLTLFDTRDRLIAVIDVAVGPDVVGLRQQLSELMPGDRIGARMVNDNVVLEGVVSSSIAADRAMRLAQVYAGEENVINMMSVGASQQVMLEVTFSEVSRSALKDIGSGLFVGNGDFSAASGVGGAVSPSPTGPVTSISEIVDSFGVFTGSLTLLGARITSVLDALERKGVVTTLAEPTLVTLSGEPATFLAGGEFPIPVFQGGGGDGDSRGITVEFKQFGVSLAFTPTVLADGVINLVVAPEVSSIDPSASVTVNGLVVPGLSTRRAEAVVELRDGESFALAGLLRTDFQTTVNQFPILGSIPIIGSLFRSTRFQRNDSELVIVVTPRLVRPQPAGAYRYPTDTAIPPDEVDLFLLGRTDGATAPIADPTAPVAPVANPIGRPPLNRSRDGAYAVPPPVPATGQGMAAIDPSAIELEVGHDY